MIDRKTWMEFKTSGMLWFINMILHTFGWAIVYSVDKENRKIEVYPARVRLRGFSEQDNTNGYINVSKFLKENAAQLLFEAEE